MSSKYSEKQEPAAIVLSPTRELANQTYIEAMKFSKGEVGKSGEQKRQSTTTNNPRRHLSTTKNILYDMITNIY